MPEEIFIIIIIAIGAGTLSGIFAQLFGYLKSRAPKSTSDASMTTSELEGMIQNWIREATRPLVSRLDKIEERLEPLEAFEVQGRLSDKSILDDVNSFEEKRDEELAPRQRTKN